MARQKKDFAAAAAAGTYNEVMAQALADTAEQTEPAAVEATPEQDTTRRNSYKHFCIALTKERHDFITTMAAMSGMSASKYFDMLIDDYMQRNADVYEQTKALQAMMRGQVKN